MEEKIFYESGNKLKLCGIINRANTYKIVIMCHGIRGNKDECGSYVDLANELNKNGYSSFRFDFDGHGESEGLDKDMTISKEIVDLESTIKMLQSIGYTEYVLVGGSFGASIVSLFPYNKFDCIKGVVLWYGALNYDYIRYGNLFTEENKNIAKEHGFYISRSMHGGKEFKFGIDLFDEVDSFKPYEEIQKCSLPKLFVHGDKDEAVPYKLSEEVSKKCINSRFVLIENGEHTFQNSNDAIKKAVDATVDFINEIL